MWPYWFLLGVFGLGAILARPDWRPDKPLASLLIGWIILVLMIGLRWEVGADWDSYNNSWRVATYRPFLDYLAIWGGDPAYYTISWLIRRLGLPYWALNLICAIIFTVGLARFARTQPMPWLAIAVAIPYLVIVVAMSGIRQASAIGFAFLALAAFHRQDTFRFFLWLMIATSFHASAILLLPLAGLSFAKTRFQAFMLLTLALVIAYYTLGASFTRYSDRYLGAAVIESGGTLFRIALNGIPALIYLLFRKSMRFEPREHTLWLNFSLAAIAMFFFFFLIPSSTALDRISLYLFPLQIAVLARLPARLRRPLDRVLLTMGVLIYLSIQLYLFLSFANNREAYLPYRMVDFFG